MMRAPGDDLKRATCTGQNEVACLWANAHDISYKFDQG